jgi:UDP-N-acetylmuramate: L-alanyl-gamma-D-glutamyl-meso-diaminopimelate ligase
MKPIYEAIASFNGASKDWRKLPKVELKWLTRTLPIPVKFCDYQSGKGTYPDRTLVACLELHTYSSLNAEFLKEYEGALEYADVAIVFYSPDAVKIKQLEEVTYEQIANAFNRKNLIIYTTN